MSPLEVCIATSYSIRASSWGRVFQIVISLVPLSPVSKACGFSNQILLYILLSRQREKLLCATHEESHGWWNAENEREWCAQCDTPVKQPLHLRLWENSGRGSSKAASARVLGFLLKDQFFFYSTRNGSHTNEISKIQLRKQFLHSENTCC